MKKCINCKKETTKKNDFCDQCLEKKGKGLTDNEITIQNRLNYLRQEIEAERISTQEIAELQSLAEHIDPSDTLLLEWAGVEEFKD